MNESVASSLPVEGKFKQDIALPFSSHLAELRKSLLLSAAAVALLSFAASWFIDPLLKDLARPVGKLYFLRPADAFLTKLKFSIIVGSFLSSPVVFFEAWSFVQRGLFRREKRNILLLTAVSLLLFVAGATFCYALVLPAGIAFLMNCGTETLVPFISVTAYLSFVSRMIVSFGIVFELPLAMWFLVKAGVVDPPALRRNRRLAIVLIFLIAAALTPTSDVFNQLLMAGPLLLLYEAGIIAARVSEKKLKGDR
jgi:sec-independent protein translocase protein TatC